LHATAVATVALAVLYFACWAVIAYQLSWFVLFIVAVQILIALAASVVYNSLQAYVQKRLAEQTLALYLSPKLVKKFASEPTLMKPGARKQGVTLFFSDIADFTKMSEGMDSDELAHLMNEYFEIAVAKCIHKTDGTVVKYIGDAIFAFWNAPEPQTDHAQRACEAVLHFRDVGAHEIRGLKLHTRIGLHTGVANVGNFGSVERVDYTALGENVNLAARLEGLNKYLGTRYLLSGETLRGGGDKLITRALGRFRLKGFEAAVEVHELVGWPQEAETTRAWREAFAAGLRDFHNGEFSAAANGFQQTLELKSEDGPSKFYLERVAEFIAQGTPKGWSGEIQLKEK
jgi:adenylate cyclase